MTLNRVPYPSPNYSSRGGATVRLICLHTAEGALTIESLGNYFASASSGVSSHAGADDKPDTVGVYVERGWKAWTASNANPVAVQIELCGFASWTPEEWDAHPAMLANCAKWIAEEAAAFGIPIVKLTADQAQGGAAGVCQHNDLGSWGGGHWDCGPGFPVDRVIDMARGGVTPEPPDILEELPTVDFILIDSGASYLVNTQSGFLLPNCPHFGDLPVLQRDHIINAVEVACGQVREGVS